MPFKLSQRNSFYNCAIRYFQSHQFAKQCFFFQKCSHVWHNGRKRARSRARLPGWCGDCNVTSTSLRPEDSCGPYAVMNGRLCVQVGQLSAECSSKCSFTTPKSRRVPLTVCSLVLRPGTYGAWELSSLIWRVMAAHMMFHESCGISQELCSASTDCISQDLPNSC